MLQSSPLLKAKKATDYDMLEILFSCLRFYVIQNKAMFTTTDKELVAISDELERIHARTSTSTTC